METVISGLLKEFAPAFGDYQLNLPEKLDSRFSGVSIDSRAKSSGGIFFCIKGERFDGHDFALDALANGCAAIVVTRSRYAEFAGLPGATVFAVDDTLAAMQQLAKFYLDLIAPRKIAITGTNGKTTTKALITGLLSSKYRTCATRGNLNNQFGVPLSIFEFTRDCQAAVFEFAMSTPGEIRRLVELFTPDIRVILNIGPAHLETLKTIDAVAEAKFEMLQDSRPEDWAVLNMDDPQIRSRSYRYKTNKLTYGTSPEYDVHPDNVHMNGAGRAHLIFHGEDITMPVLGLHHVHNCLAAISVAKLMGIPFALVKSGIESFVPAGNRMATEEYLGITIVNDAYNSNPVSARGAIETVASMKTPGRRVVVFGDMLELGSKSDEYHAEMGRIIAAAHVDFLILLGTFSTTVKNAAVTAGLDAARIAVVADHSAAVELLTAYLHSGDLLLLKASRGIRLELVEQGLKATLGRRN